MNHISIFGMCFTDSNKFIKINNSRPMHAGHKQKLKAGSYCKFEMFFQCFLSFLKIFLGVSLWLVYMYYCTT